MASEFSARFDNAVAEERYDQVAIHKNIWEEQGENAIVNVRGKLIPADAAAINETVDLPNNQPSIYELMTTIKDIDYNSIKDSLCLPNTEWNITGKNPSTVSRPILLLEAKLWNTIVKQNLMPTSHNQTMDRKRLVLIHSIIFGTKFNVGEVIAQELSEACKNDKGILTFPCLISALCRRHGVPTYNNDKYTVFRTGWDRKHYLKKMDVADAIPIQVAMPTPAQLEHTEAATLAAATQEEPAGSEPTTPPAAPQGSPSATSAAQGSFVVAPTPPAPPADPQTSPAHSTETPLLYILQLRSQIQRIEARQIEFIAESKVFQTTLLQILYKNFPTAKFPPAQHTPPTAPADANSTATPSCIRTMHPLSLGEYCPNFDNYIL
ncbi:hypothetical protein V6N12_069156 [Hibiscus sabdariffa]|uniref:Putative plant transposon protein domain-containing protein n=1 Tax=Hibiscus sabdariffa TaxID=183260 RepID=A0ABR2FD58_9ROSI